MSLSEPFIRRPVATTLLTCGIALAGLVAYFQLPVSPLPQVDRPTITVYASMAGASPETMAKTVATPLERHLGTIADVTEMTSVSRVGQTQVTLEFGLSRDIDGAARDVQAAINGARADLPTALRSNPTYRKENLAESPILILALTSKTLTQGQLYDAASTILQQKISQVDGVGDVTLGGSSLPAVRIEMNPQTLFKYGIGMEDVRAALSAANANSPKGAVESPQLHWQIYSNDQATQASAYRPLVVAYRNGRAVRLSDVANVLDSVEDVRNVGVSKDAPAVLAVISREPGANIIDTVDRVLATLPALRAALPGGANLDVAMDRSTTIRASLRDVELTLGVSVILVIIVVFAFLRDPRATLIPSVAVPISLIGTLGAMYLLGYSLDNLSLMALTVATGFVVDDAIVVMENIVRHIEAGVPRFEAAIQGAREIGFTVLSMSLSLVAVFIPMLLMGDILGRLFREFTMTLSIAILISMLISLTTTPMMCARLLGTHQTERHGRFYRWSEHLFAEMLDIYRRSLRWSLRHSRVMLTVLLVTIALNFWLFARIPKDAFPEQDTGLMFGGFQADQSSSFQRTSVKLRTFVHIVQADPAVADAVGFMSGTTGGRVFISLKPLDQRKASAEEVITRLRPQLNAVAGATLYLVAGQDLHIGGRMSNASYQYTLQADDLDQLRE
ncbi:MAG TPA: efflux RND transporter permease subunit, partial [Opitutaceae bacterium]|nr:efflux RND transporter permease subunit [Opitutaceae bacterium]